MKKSQLRKIIRESIKELITEQQQSQMIVVGYPNAPGWAGTNYYCAGSQPGGFRWACCCLQQNYNPGTTTIDYVGGPAGNTNLFSWLGRTVPCVQNCNCTNSGQTWMTNQQVNDLIANHGTMPIYNASSTFPIGNFIGVWDDGNTTNQFGNSISCNQWVTDNLVSGCTNPSATNYNPSANQDDGSCDYGFACMPLGNHPKFGSECVPGTQNNPGTFTTEQECLASGCEPLRDPDTKKGVEKNITPFTTDPQSKVIDPEIDRMQDLANIKK
jgi:hypothetical protein